MRSGPAGSGRVTCYVYTTKLNSKGILRYVTISTEVECGLTSLRCCQFLHYDIWRDGDVGLTARGDENELSPNGPSGGTHLEEVSTWILTQRFRIRLTSMSMAILRLIWSMYTSLWRSANGSPQVSSQTYNSSRQRIGEPMASQRDKRRHTWEKDFSPPERVFAPRPVLSSLVISGSTCTQLDTIIQDVNRGWRLPGDRAVYCDDQLTDDRGSSVH